MLQMLVTDAAKDKINTHIKGAAKLLLSLDDGVGDYSDVGSCSLGISFDVIAVAPDTPVKDYDQKLSSNIGDFYYKGYSESYIDEPGLKLDVLYNQLALFSDSGELDTGIRIIDKR